MHVFRGNSFEHYFKSSEWKVCYVTVSKPKLRIAGYEYYINNFFSQDGRSNYYNNKVYPIDIHAPAQLIVTVAKLDRFNEQRELIDKVLNWTIKHMQHPSGYFYYQKKKGISSKIAYMRWAQAWMFYAMSYYLHLNEIR